MKIDRSYSVNPRISDLARGDKHQSRANAGRSTKNRTLETFLDSKITGCSECIVMDKKYNGRYRIWIDANRKPEYESIPGFAEFNWVHNPRDPKAENPRGYFEGSLSDLTPLQNLR